jgi:DNA-binding GntR family transcriptional regulator
VTAGFDPDPPAAGVERKRPAYELVAATLRNAIATELLPTGTVLTEGVLAALFGASRSPIKQAFAELEAERLLCRFEGRGMLVGGQAVPPRRIRVTADMLGIGPDPAGAVRDDAWETLYYALERDILLASIFGRFRINEVALARHYGVGRTVARNLLLRAHALGIVAKSDSSHWYGVEMSEVRLRDLYDLRILLEPALVGQTAPRIPPDELAAMAGRLTAAAVDFSRLSVAGLDALEHDVHVRCLSYGGNAEMVEALKRTHCTLVVGKHIQAALIKTPQIDPFLDEHLAIVEALRAGDGRRAQRALKEHLKASQIKAAERLTAFRAQQQIGKPPYISTD